RYPGTSPRWRCAYRGYKPELTGSPDKTPAAIREHLPGGGATGSDTFLLPVVSQHRRQLVARIRRQPLSGYISPVAGDRE
ncbi:hypothetical protein, partial [Klebsiella quasivariicola]|uniref:hypothetical protein n=1 Tax=Klebsiella quasivariicola TaxID=2026240 RepID=UPI0024322BAE